MDLNNKLWQLLCEGNSIRSCSRLLNMTYKNTYNKFLWLCQLAQQQKQNLKLEAQTLYFDEMESIHHTKCKPLSIMIMVNEKYEILSLKVAQMPAKGRLAEVSRLKYGPRPDERAFIRDSSFEKLKEQLKESPKLIRSDAHPAYRAYVERYFAEARYEIYNRAQKERHRERLHEKFQKKKYDPMFVLNQRCAQLRDKIRRLTRRSWCTTKKIENLQGHLDLFLVRQFQ